jgi:hypothetical protein
MRETGGRVCANKDCKAPIVRISGCFKVMCARCHKCMCFKCPADAMVAYDSANETYEHLNAVHGGYFWNWVDYLLWVLLLICLIFRNILIIYLIYRQISYILSNILLLIFQNYQTFSVSNKNLISQTFLIQYAKIHEYKTSEKQIIYNF